MAFDRGAVPEVLGGAGVLVSDKDPYALAAAITALSRDATRRRQLREAGRARLHDLDLGTAAERFVDCVLIALAGHVLAMLFQQLADWRQPEPEEPG